MSTASDFLDLVFVCVDCDFWKVPFHVYGGAVVLLMRVGFSVVAAHGGVTVYASLFWSVDKWQLEGQDGTTFVWATTFGQSRSTCMSCSSSRSRRT